MALPLPSSNLAHAKGPTMKRLNHEELKERRRRRLFFNCDEIFVPGHKCKRLFYIEGYFPDEEDIEEGEEEEEEEELVISIHALA